MYVGVPAVVYNFKVYSADLTSVFLSWNIDPPPNENTTVILYVTDYKTNAIESVNITGNYTTYQYFSDFNNSCSTYNFTLSPQHVYAGCVNVSGTVIYSTVTSKYKMNYLIIIHVYRASIKSKHCICTSSKY